MAKRDTLYTVNRWNKPFFEEAKRRKLYLGGGNRNDITPGLGGLDIHGYSNIGGIVTTAPTIKPLWTLLDNADFTGYKGNYNPVNNLATLYDIGVGTGGNRQHFATANFVNTENKQKKDWMTRASDAITRLNNVYKTTQQLTKLGDNLKQGAVDIKQLGKPAPAVTSPVSSVLKEASRSITVPAENASALVGGALIGGDTLISHIGTVNPTTDAITNSVRASSQKLADSLMTAQHASKPNFFATNLGKGLAMTAADLAGDAIRGWVRNPKLNNTTAARVGDIFSKAGTLAGTGLMASGYGLPVGLAVLGAGKAIGMLADQFGSVYEDNGATAYTNWLRNLNTNGSDEYLAQLRASVGMGPEATATRGAFAGYGDVHKAERTNATQGNELNRFYRGIDDALANNAWLRQQYALNDYSRAAMGGKLNRRKCNCKATGGILNNAYIDPATATGYGTLQDIINIQLTKNQNSQDVGSMGNSFMGMPNTGGIFASGGPMIKPSHRGRLTELKKRTGKTEAELYNDGNPDHKKMVVFALNSRRWHKHALGGYLKGKVYDIPKEEVQRLIRAGYEVEYL